MIVLLSACYGYESMQNIIYVTWNLLVQDLHTIQIAYMLSGYGGMNFFFFFFQFLNLQTILISLVVSKRTIHDNQLKKFAIK